MATRVVTEPEYVATLSDALRKNLKGAVVHHEHVRGDRYRFIVAWKRFDAIDHPERQRKVWDIAEQALGKDLLKVSMILTLGNEDLPKE